MAEAGFKAYQKYLAVKGHFTRKDYDYFKYKGKIKASESSFKKRNDRYHFAKLENKHKKDLLPFLVSNMVVSSEVWVGELLSENSEKIYKKWQKKIESLKYTFRTDMSKLRDLIELHDYEFDDLFKMKDNDHPIIFKQLMTEEISLESFVILDRILNFISYFDKKMLDDPIWTMYNVKIVKYQRFIDINKFDYHEIVKNIFLR